MPIKIILKGAKPKPIAPPPPIPVSGRPAAVGKPHPKPLPATGTSGKPRPLPAVSKGSVPHSTKYTRKDPNELVSPDGKHKGGRGNKKKAPPPFDTSTFPEVLNINAMAPEEAKALERSGEAVYIGRDPHSAERGRFGNPFPIGQFYGDRDEVCDRHEKWLVTQLMYTARGQEQLVDLVESLRGKKLLCFCKPARCHGDFLRLIANAPDDQLVSWLKSL